MPGLRLPAGVRVGPAPSSSLSLVCASESSNASAASQCRRHAQDAKQSLHCAATCRSVHERVSCHVQFADEQQVNKDLWVLCQSYQGYVDCETGDRDALCLTHSTTLWLYG